MAYSKLTKEFWKPQVLYIQFAGIWWDVLLKRNTYEAYWITLYYSTTPSSLYNWNGYHYIASRWYEIFQYGLNIIHNKTTNSCIRIRIQMQKHDDMYSRESVCYYVMLKLTNNTPITTNIQFMTYIMMYYFFCCRNCMRAEVNGVVRLYASSDIMLFWAVLSIHFLCLHRLIWVSGTKSIYKKKASIITLT